MSFAAQRGAQPRSNTPWALIALGANLGDARRTLAEAMDRLQELSARPLVSSSLWRSDPVGCPAGSPAFINAVVMLFPRSDETPLTLLHKLQGLEKEFGRRPKTVLNEPRPLDLDLIAFADVIGKTDELTLPHPRAHVRRFVLAPLAEIAPDLRLPGQSRTVRQLLNELGSEQGVKRLELEGPQLT